MSPCGPPGLRHPGSTLDLLGGAGVRARVGRAAREHLGTRREEHPERAADIVGRIVKRR
ncbi:hypothetical protein ACH4FA_30295 [Streptomyces sp. NPDC017966]|uniref:hypothetical protein n=1 Tax=Streptomyces sp. NPDC017966 TaxID=3365023 RepID=UPI0037A76A34